MVRLFLFCLISLIIYSCEKGESYSGNCDFPLSLSEDSYTNGPFDQSMQIYSLDWNGECLDINLGYSGGCEEHMFDVVTNGTIIKTNPPIISIAIIHDNTDLCQAYLSKNISVDISELDISKEYDSFIIKLKNFDDYSITIEQ